MCPSQKFGQQWRLKRSQLLVKHYNSNTLPEDKKMVRINLLIAPSISLTDLILSPSEFCKIHPLVVNLFLVKIKQRSSAGRIKYFVKNWQNLTNDPMILHVVRSYEIPLILLSRQSRLPKKGFLLNKMLLPKDKICKIGLKDAYFAIPLSVKSKNYVKFHTKVLLYEFCCLCFGLSLAPLIFTKLLKVSISLLRKLIVIIILYLDKML